MSRPPSFQFYPRDWIIDTRHLTPEQRGRYHDALCESWIAESYGVATENQWRLWMGYTPEEWSEARSVFAPFFLIHGLQWVQKRLRSTRHEQAIQYASSRAGGEARSASMTPAQRSELASKAAQARWSKEVKAYASDASVMPPPASASASASALEEEESTPLVNGSPAARVDPDGVRLRREWQEAFAEHFWPAYPRKVARAASLKAWEKLAKGQSYADCEALLGRVLKSLRWYERSEWRSRDPDKIPHAATWLNQRRFDDETTKRD